MPAQRSRLVLADTTDPALLERRRNPVIRVRRFRAKKAALSVQSHPSIQQPDANPNYASLHTEAAHALLILARDQQNESSIQHIANNK
jgi:hypothetical protein